MFFHIIPKNAAIRRMKKSIFLYIALAFVYYTFLSNKGCLKKNYFIASSTLKFNNHKQYYERSKIIF